MKKNHLLTLFIIFLYAGQYISGQDQNTLNRIEINEKSVFLNGMNLAWINWANDLTSFNQSQFSVALDGISGYHGNALRWWLHTDGTVSPVFTDGKVSGLKGNEIDNLKMALDLAMERGIVVSLCLWSFDMLQSGLSEVVLERNKNLLEDEECLEAYINNALIPLVEGVKGHPAILCWEIFNEPEGMASDVDWGGWTPVTTTFDPYIQRFINRAASAIHQTDSKALVSSGCWAFKVMTDIGANKNLYRDDRLIEAGGKEDGTLDFYMAHYYEWAGTAYSPFHHEASYWELDKPIIIGEFSAKGPFSGEAGIDIITPTEAYNTLYNNGYAGALSWTWTGHDGNGGLEEAGPAMQDLYEKHKNDIEIEFSDMNYSPYPIKEIQNVAVPKNSDDTTLVDLKDIFYDYEQGNELDFSIQLNSDTNIVQVDIDTNDSIILIFSPEAIGLSAISVMAADTGGKSTVTSFIVSIFNPDTENKALLRNTSVSSIEATNYYSTYAVDGDIKTRWSTKYSDYQWFIVEFEQIYSIQRVFLNWETAYGKVYDIKVSEDGTNWTTAYLEGGGNGGKDLIIFDPINAKYLKFVGNGRGTEWGYSLYELEVYTTTTTNNFPVLVGSIEDQEAYNRTLFEFTIPESIFFDADTAIGDKLIYAATLNDGSKLPFWLKFDIYSGTFSGTPADKDSGTVTIKVVATDVFSESVSTTFDLTVNYVPEISVTNYTMDDISVFPIPAQNLVNIKLPSDYLNYSVKIYDILGNVILQNIDFSPGINQIDLSEINKGIYILTIHSGVAEFRQTLIIK